MVETTESRIDALMRLGDKDLYKAKKLYSLQESDSSSQIEKELFYLQFPDYLIHLRYKEYRSAFEKKYLEDAVKLREGLKSLSLTELQNRVLEELALVDWWSEGVNDADYEYWLKMDSWTYEESVLLVHGLEPRKINIGKIQKYSNFIGKAKSICEMAEVLSRAVKHGQRHQTKIPISPSDFINWCIEKGFDVPKQLNSEAQNKSLRPNIKQAGFEKNEKQTRKTRWHVVVENFIHERLKEGNLTKPHTNALIHYFQKELKAGSAIILDFNRETNEVEVSGNKNTLKKGTIGNVLREKWKNITANSTN
jgi:hypothetical protein